MCYAGRLYLFYESSHSDYVKVAKNNIKGILYQHHLGLRSLYGATSFNSCKAINCDLTLLNFECSPTHFWNYEPEGLIG